MLKIDSPDSWTSQIQTGWRAHGIERTALHNVSVQSAQGNRALSREEMLLENRLLWYEVVPQQEQQAYTIMVEQNQGHSEIFDGSHRRLRQIPPIPCSDDRKLEETVNHLARFKTFEHLHNPN